MKNKLLSITAIGETCTGLILLFFPGIAIFALFGVETSGIGLIITRIAGICLIVFGYACWPNQSAANNKKELSAMTIYGLLISLYLSYVGYTGEVGILLWPAVIVHIVITLFLAWQWLPLKSFFRE